MIFIQGEGTQKLTLILDSSTEEEEHGQIVPSSEDDDDIGTFAPKYPSKLSSASGVTAPPPPPDAVPTTSKKSASSSPDVLIVSSDEETGGARASTSKAVEELTQVKNLFSKHNFASFRKHEKKTTVLTLFLPEKNHQKSANCSMASDRP